MGIDANAIGMRARRIVRFDTAMAAKVVLGDTSVEGIGLKIFLTAEQSKIVFGDDKV